MKETYSEAMVQVFKDEGGFSNHPSDPGGATNYGITIHDARQYWKYDASVEDMRHMPKSAAEEIYRKHYAIPLHYDSLPAGVDYAVLDYGINSGIGRASKVYARVKTTDTVETIKRIYAERLHFLKGLHTWPVFGKGWAARVHHGEALAIALANKYKHLPESVKHIEHIEHLEDNKIMTTSQVNVEQLLQDVEKALEAAQKILPFLQGFPGLQFLTWIIPILPAIENAIKALEAAGKTKPQALVALSEHLTPGEPNSPVLS